MDDSDKLIEQLEMNPHPEGGYYSESFRDRDNSVSLIYYLLKKGQRSHWHRLTKNEIFIKAILYPFTFLQMLKQLLQKNLVIVSQIMKIYI